MGFGREGEWTCMEGMLHRVGEGKLTANHDLIYHRMLSLKLTYLYKQKGIRESLSDTSV